jgi:hypothetical protein
VKRSDPFSANGAQGARESFYAVALTISFAGIPTFNLRAKDIWEQAQVPTQFCLISMARISSLLRSAKRRPRKRLNYKGRNIPIMANVCPKGGGI